MKVAFFGDSPARLKSVYSEAQMARLGNVFEVVPGLVSSDNFSSMIPALSDVEAVFSTWSMPSLTMKQIAEMPELKVLFYGAGSVKRFARPFLENGVRISAGWKVNGRMVACFAFAQIILACKGYFVNVAEYGAKRDYSRASRGPGIYGATVALLGGGSVARHLIEMLRGWDCKIMLYDPFITEEEAERLGVEKADIEKCFEEAVVVSNHMPDLESTRGVLTEKLFSKMRTKAVFINTARGITLDNPGFLKVFTERPDLTALLDVTEPEPLPEDSPLFELPNVNISTHMAGSLNNERFYIGDKMVEAFFEWLQYGTVRDEITLKMLDMLA